MNRSGTCPCGSKQAYNKCCKRFHAGQAAPGNALELMRSRYCAYALGLSDYIVQTTHPEHPNYTPNLKEWKKELQQFSKMTRFDGLTIVDFRDGENTATVTFTAHLRQGSQDVSFTEMSGFVKEDGVWLYHSGKSNSAADSLLGLEQGKN